MRHCLKFATNTYRNQKAPNHGYFIKFSKMPLH